MNYIMQNDFIVVAVTAIVALSAFYNRYIYLFIVKYYMMLKYQNDGAFIEKYTDHLLKKLLKEHESIEIRKKINKNKSYKQLQSMYLEGVK